MTTGGVGKASATELTVLEVVGNRTGAQRLVGRAVAMAAKAQRQSAITLVGEEAQKMFIPTPCAMPGSVDEKERSRMRFTGTPFIDHLKHVARGFLWRRFFCAASATYHAAAATLPDLVPG